MPMFSKALETKVIDGRVYVDLEQLTQLIFDIANQSAIAAAQMRDPALGVMTLGVSHIGKALDGALELKREAAGLSDDHKPCGRSRAHSAHNWMQSRRMYRCKGVDQDE